MGFDGGEAGSFLSFPLSKKSHLRDCNVTDMRNPVMSLRSISSEYYGMQRGLPVPTYRSMMHHSW